LHALGKGGQLVVHAVEQEDYPALESDDIRAVLLYARDVVASERVYPIDLPVPA
jgi:uncharacterized protein (DUF433 family)